MGLYRNIKQSSMHHLPTTINIRQGLRPPSQKATIKLSAHKMITYSQSYCSSYSKQIIKKSVIQSQLSIDSHPKPVNQSQLFFGSHSLPFIQIHSFKASHSKEVIQRKSLNEHSSKHSFNHKHYITLYLAAQNC